MVNNNKLSQCLRECLLYWIACSTDCPSKVDTPDLPATMGCHIGSSCTAIDCCTHVDTLQRDIHTFLSLEPCHFTLAVGIEKLHSTLTLFDYKWGEENVISLFGVFTLRLDKQNC